jgi:hypothetical protein
MHFQNPCPPSALLREPDEAHSVRLQVLIDGSIPASPACPLLPPFCSMHRPRRRWRSCSTARRPASAVLASTHFEEEGQELVGVIVVGSRGAIADSSSSLGSGELGCAPCFAREVCAGSRRRGGEDWGERGGQVGWSRRDGVCGQCGGGGRRVCVASHILTTKLLLTVKIRQPSHEFTFGVGISFIPYPLVLTPVV